VIKPLGNPTVLALTATATPAVREDILMQLGIPNVKPIVKGFDRPNLRYEVNSRRERSRQTQDSLKELFESGLDGTGIIYTATIKNALEVQRYLHDQLDLPAAVYHSKLQKHDRVSVHELFMQEAIRAVVATNAFGLGHRQAEHPLRRALRSAGFGRSVHAGSRPRRPRRRSLALHPALPHERHARAELLPDRQVSRHRRGAESVRHARDLRRPGRRRERSPTCARSRSCR
jgi:superfamily II DNA/RNA helicase